MEQEKIYIEPFGNEEKEALKRLSAHALPDEPARHGMKAEKVKGAFWKPFTEGEYAVIGLLNRLIAALNSLFAEQEATNTDAANEIWKVRDEITNLGNDNETVYNTETGKLELSDAVKAALMSSEEKKNLQTLVDLLGEESGDGDNDVVNKIREVLAAFASFPEGDALADALARKLDKQDGSTGTPTFNGHEWDVGAMYLYGIDPRTDWPTQVVFRSVITPSVKRTSDQTIMRRDTYGRSKVNNPIDDRDIVNLQTLRAKFQALGESDEFDYDTENERLSLSDVIKSGLMSATDKKNLDTLVSLLGTTSGDNGVVDKIHEVLATFEEFPEGVELAGKFAECKSYVDDKITSRMDEFLSNLLPFAEEVSYG